MRIRIRDSKSFWHEIWDGKFGSGIRDKHPGSATLVSLLNFFAGLNFWMVSVFSQFLNFLIVFRCSSFSYRISYPACFRRLCRWFHAERERKRRKTLILRRAVVQPAWNIFLLLPSDIKMGVLGLWSLLEPVGKPVPVESLGMSLMWCCCRWFCLISFGFR